MALPLILLLMFTQLTVTLSEQASVLEPVPLIQPFPIVLNQPLTLTYRYSKKDVGGLKNVTRIQINKLLDIGHIDPAPPYKFSVSPSQPEEVESNPAGRSDIRPQFSSVNMTKGDKQEERQELVITVFIPKAKCSDIGMVQFLTLGREYLQHNDKEIFHRKYVYLDTESHKPVIEAITEADISYYIGSRVNLNCSLTATTRNVKLEFKFKLPQSKKFQSRLPLDGRHSVKNQDQDTQHLFVLVPGPCPRVALYFHYITFSFLLDTHEQSKMEIICLATLRPSAKTEDGQRVFLEKRENITIGLDNCFNVEDCEYSLGYPRLPDIGKITKDEDDIFIMRETEYIILILIFLSLSALLGALYINVTSSEIRKSHRHGPQGMRRCRMTYPATKMIKEALTAWDESELLRARASELDKQEQSCV